MPFVKVSSGTQFHYQIPSCPDHKNPFLDSSKPTVLLLHPRLFDSYFFAPQWRDPRLSLNYNLLAIDHHYHGKTKAKLDDSPYDFQLIAKEIIMALDKLGVSKCHVFGNSLGAPIAFRIYAQKPSLVSSMILCGKHPPVETEENKEQYKFIRDSCFAKDDQGRDRLASDVVHGLHYVYFGDETGADAIIDEWAATSSFRPSNVLLITKIFSSLLDRVPLPQSTLDAITCPILIIHGGADVPYPVQCAYDLYDALPNAKEKKLVIVENAPHFLSWTHAKDVNDATVEFLDGLEHIDSREMVEKVASEKVGKDMDPATQSLQKKKSFWKKIVA